MKRVVQVLIVVLVLLGAVGLTHGRMTGSCGFNADFPPCAQ
jgi:hypothetical protein